MMQQVVIKAVSVSDDLVMRSDARSDSRSRFAALLRRRFRAVERLVRQQRASLLARIDARGESRSGYLARSDARSESRSGYAALLHRKFVCALLRFLAQAGHGSADGLRSEGVRTPCVVVREHDALDVPVKIARLPRLYDSEVGEWPEQVLGLVLERGHAPWIEVARGGVFRMDEEYYASLRFIAHREGSERGV